jgi:hypothetical protein
MTSRFSRYRRIPTARAIALGFRANIGGQLLQRRGHHSAQLAPKTGTTHSCPPEHMRVTPDLGRTGPSIVDGHKPSTLQELLVVPNPQHLLLTLFFETSLHEEKCPL